MVVLFFFFFSSRRRHTRSDRDWSSDVCSSDLFEDRFGDEVLRGDEFQPGGLAPGFIAKEIGDLRIDAVERAIHAVIGFSGHLYRPMCLWRTILTLSTAFCETPLKLPQCDSNTISTSTSTSTRSPFNRVGSNCHCFTASKRA